MDKPTWSFDLLRTFRSHGRPRAEEILGRPFRGIPELPTEQWNKMGLYPEARVDLKRQCVERPCLAAFNARYVPKRGPGNRQVGEQRERLHTDESCWNFEIV